MRISMTRRLDRTVNTIATVGLLGLSTALGAEAQAGILLPPMVGMTVNSYSMTANTPSRAGATATSLTIANSTNPSFNPSLILGQTSGDYADGGNWGLAAVGADYGPLFSLPNALNIVGGACQTVGSSAPNFSSSDTLSVSMVLVFSGSQDFYGLNILGGDSTIASATLAQSGGSTADLLTTSSGTSFAAGTYTLTMSVTADNTVTGGFSAYAAFTTAYAVPGSGLAAIAGGLLTSLGGGRRRR